MGGRLFSRGRIAPRAPAPSVANLKMKLAIVPPRRLLLPASRPYALHPKQRLGRGEPAMSRGHGKVERAILEALSKRKGHRGKGSDVELLAHYVRSLEMGSMSEPSYRLVRQADEGRVPITRSELESVRRALRNLRKQGLIEPPMRIQRVVYRRAAKKPQAHG
jgi:hypothetical protein